ncbi:MAG TPA: YncE family protein [Bacteroidota bacterium]|nr:YncE family protein [Bacteroidota bacterium]
MKAFIAIVFALCVCAELTPGLCAQNFKVRTYNIGGDGGTDYLTAEPGTGRVFVTRGSHVMVIDGRKGTVIGDIPTTPGVHGVALVSKYHHGFTTNRGDSTVSMFDLKTLALVKKIKIPAGGLDGIMYDDFSNRIILTNHSTIGTATALDARTGAITGETKLEDNSPEGAASDGKGKLFINNESKNTIQVLDARTMNVLDSWPLAPCDGPTGIVYDRATRRIFSGCSKTSAVLDAATGKIVATIPNGDGVDALGWDAKEKLLYIPAGRDSTVTIVHQESPDTYRVVATVTTMAGAKTISVDPVTHTAYLFQPRYAPAPEVKSDAPAARRGRGPVIGAYLIVITH